MQLSFVSKKNKLKNPSEYCYPQTPHKRAEIMTLLFHGILHHNYINPPIYIWFSPGQWKWTSSTSPNGNLWIKIRDYQMLMKCIFTLFWRHSLLERERFITTERLNLLMPELWHINIYLHMVRSSEVDGLIRDTDALTDACA